MRGPNERKPGLIGSRTQIRRQRCAKCFPFAGLHRDCDFQIEVAPFGTGLTGRFCKLLGLLEVPKLEEEPGVMTCKRWIVLFNEFMGVDDPHKIFVIPNVGKSSCSDCDVVRIPGIPIQFLRVPRNRQALLPGH
jgi:hypothetical protein